MDSVLLIGGCNFLGQWILIRLIEEDWAKEIRVIDRALPVASHFHHRFQRALKDPRVSYEQCNLLLSESVERGFDRGPEKGPWDAVINCACDRRPMTTSPLRDLILTLTRLCALQAKCQGVGTFLQVSSGEVYSSHQELNTEESHVGDYGTEMESASYYHQAEELLEDLSGDEFHVIIIRPAQIYGAGDIGSLSHFMALVRGSKECGESIRFMNAPDSYYRVIHVYDLALACIKAAHWSLRHTHHPRAFEIFNLTDQSITTHADILDEIGKLFRVVVKYKQRLLIMIKTMTVRDKAKAAQIEYANALSGWRRVLKDAHIHDTPLDPYAHAAILGEDGMAMDGSKAKVTLDLTYHYPSFSREALEETLGTWQEYGWWPLPDTVLAEEYDT